MFHWITDYARWLHLRWPSNPQWKYPKISWGLASFFSLIFFPIFCVFLYHWKSYNSVFPVYQFFEFQDWFPFGIGIWLENQGGEISRLINDDQNLLHTLVVSMTKPNFFYTLVYSVVVLIFGIRRIRKWKTPYIKIQTWSLISVQILFLFILPEILLPWAGFRGWFLEGTWGGEIANWFFEPLDSYGIDRAYWRSYGFVFAWPLFVWNFFTSKPLWGWLIVGSLQTFFLIPWMVRRWGKGAYCGWICSCGALAETLGDAHRSKMPQGQFWNRLNLLGQIILGIAFLLLFLKIGSWIWPTSFFSKGFDFLFEGIPFFHYTWFVDLLLSGIVGVGLYFWFSGRTWCRFACPLAAWMHIWASLSRFRIFVDSQKCIGCQKCSNICHQGIHVMAFAKEGKPMADPECVRCGACVAICPKEVLSFGQIDLRSGEKVSEDRWSCRSN